MGEDAAQSACATRPQALPDIYLAVPTGGRIFQGEVLTKIEEWVPFYSDHSPDTVSTVSPMRHELAVVLSQDCDLAQDWTKRQPQPNIETDLACVLLCRAAVADTAFDTEGQFRSSDMRKLIRKNKSERYHYLAEVPLSADGASFGHPPILIDFRAIFTIRTVDLYRQLRVGAPPIPRRFRLATPWAEHLQSRFAGYHARIGLPRDHFVPESRRADQ